MVSLEGSPTRTTRFPLSRSLSPSTTKIHRHVGRSMRTIRSNLNQTDGTTCSSLPSPAPESRECTEFHSENLSESVVDMRLGELAAKYSNSDDGDGGGRNGSAKSNSSLEEELLEFSRAFSDFSSCSSDVSGELERLANLPPPPPLYDDDRENSDPNPEIEPCVGFLQRENFSSEIIESISPEDLQPTVKLCVDGLRSPSTAVKRSAAAKLRLLAKNRSENRALIGESDAIPELIALLKSSSDSLTQEHTVTALLNLSLHEENRKSIMKHSSAVKSLIHVLKTGTETSKQNAACALLNLALIEENKSSIGASGAVPPLVSLLINGMDRGKKDAITTLYKLCSLAANKERAVSCGVVRPLVEFVGQRENGLAEKAMVVLNSVAGIGEGREAIVAEGGIGALVEVIEDGSDKGKEFAVATLLTLCSESVRNRGLLVREGAIPPLVALSQSGSSKAKHRAEKLLAYLRESRQGTTSSSP